MKQTNKLHDELQTLIEKNRDALIKSTVSDHEVQAQLIAISQAIKVIRGKDPSQVAAWGLGCGGGCLVSPQQTPGEL